VRVGLGLVRQVHFELLKQAAHTTRRPAGSLPKNARPLVRRTPRGFPRRRGHAAS
jgi:hypothetical protein